MSNYLPILDEIIKLDDTNLLKFIHDLKFILDKRVHGIGDLTQQVVIRGDITVSSADADINDLQTKFNELLTQLKGS